jgi:hypothetical protein
MTPATAVAVAVTYVWLGMVLAISFLEAPLKFRAPGITVPLGLGIGRLVFRALNSCEALFAVTLVVTVIIGDLPVSVVAAGALAIATLVAQLALVRPRLTRRTDAVLAGSEPPRSRVHLAYLGLELIKVVALLVCGITLLV